MLSERPDLQHHVGGHCSAVFHAADRCATDGALSRYLLRRRASCYPCSAQRVGPHLVSALWRAVTLSNASRARCSVGRESSSSCSVATWASRSHGHRRTRSRSHRHSNRACGSSADSVSTAFMFTCSLRCSHDISRTSGIVYQVAAHSHDMRMGANVL